MASSPVLCAFVQRALRGGRLGGIANGRFQPLWQRILRPVAHVRIDQRCAALEVDLVKIVEQGLALSIGELRPESQQMVLAVEAELSLIRRIAVGERIHPCNPWRRSGSTTGVRLRIGSRIGPAPWRTLGNGRPWVNVARCAHVNDGNPTRLTGWVRAATMCER